MKKIRVFLKSRALLLAALLGVLGGSFGLLAPAKVASSAVCAFRPVIRTYYSDATFTTAVGQRGTDCSCNPVSWGVTSSFVQSQTLCCNVNTC
jgi:hypothetical protein